MICPRNPHDLRQQEIKKEKKFPGCEMHVYWKNKAVQESFNPMVHVFTVL